MFDYKYLSEKHLKGFKNYKYSAIDTSPLSKYVMHPAWNTAVKIFPKWVAPNLLTFLGFVCMLVNVILLMYYDYNLTASGGDPGAKPIPQCIFTICGVLLFLAYNLDGIDGKQARRLGVSGPLGEMFDHGIDSYIVFLIPFCLFSVYGRDEYSISVFRGYLVVVSVVLNFYVSHWEKYNTGILYLPWGYDLSMWVSSLMFLVAGLHGPEVYKTHILGMTFVQALEIAIHATGLFTTLPIAVYNVILSYKNRTGKMYSLLDALRPIWPILIMMGTMTSWAVTSQGIIERDLRAFLLLFGTLFSNIASRLIVAEMSEQKCDTICWINVPLVFGVGAAKYLPQYELGILYLLAVFAICAHIHYGVCVVRQMCDHFKVQCFKVPKEKIK